MTARPIDPWLVKRNAVCPVCKLVLQPQPPESPDSRLSTNIGVDPASNNSTAINIPETPLAMPAQNSLAWHERLRDIIFSRRRTASVIPMTELPSD
jgi:hypothetical protein